MADLKGMLRKAVNTILRGIYKIRKSSEKKLGSSLMKVWSRLQRWSATAQAPRPSHRQFSTFYSKKIRRLIRTLSVWSLSMPKSTNHYHPQVISAHTKKKNGSKQTKSPGLKPQVNRLSRKTTLMTLKSLCLRIALRLKKICPALRAHLSP